MIDERFARILVTAALPYANGPAHIGHLAGAYLPADIYCRYQRLMGRDVLFICGSDEHGVPIILHARDRGISPKEVVDEFHTLLKSSFADFGISFDYYGRTSSQCHRETSQEFFRKLARAGAFKLKTESQLFDPEASMFLADRFVKGTCPICQYEDAYGDQCEKCGRSLSPKELIEPRSAITNATPVLKETTHFYLPLGHVQSWLQEWTDSHQDWKPNVIGQAQSWLKEGLADRSMTRNLPWGVPLPEDVAEEAGLEAEGKVLYVWFDAPIGYISATREWAECIGQKDAWKTYWQQSDTKLIHFIGKDNIVFHCLIFPAMLKLHGDYVLPNNVPANEFLNIEGQKLSTSRGWAVWLHEFLRDFPADYLRYALLSILPETRDSDFSWKDLQARINNELADTLGNFVNRSLAFAQRFAENKVPSLQNPSPIDQEMLEALTNTPDRIGKHLEQYRLREAGHELMALARRANKYFNDSQPWATRSSDPNQCANTIHISLQVCASLSVICEPFLPFTASRIRKMLQLQGIRSSTQAQGTEGIGWLEAANPLMKAGHSLGPPEILYEKIDNQKIQTQMDKLNAKKAVSNPDSNGYPSVADPVEYEDFAKLDFRVALITSAEKLAKSKKLIRCEIDLGFEQRQIVAGVAEQMVPEELIGKKVVVVANLAPRKIMGIPSNGMLLMASDRQGKLAPLLCDSEPGSKVS